MNALNEFLEEISPNNNNLEVHNGIAKSTIFDIELDPLNCEFDGVCVKINTEVYEYISLDVENLYKLIELIEKSNEYYNLKS